MTSTGRSESMNAFFDGYVHSNTMLNKFLTQYDKTVRAPQQAQEKRGFPEDEHASHLK